MDRESTVTEVDGGFLMKRLLKERNISWYCLGEELEVERSTLNSFKMQFHSDGGCLIEVIDKWLDTCEYPSYLPFVYALKNIGKVDLAKEIAEKFSKFVLMVL